ncbi:MULTISPECIES: MarR family winged helix-turn-helix transcriptional regulator [Lactobacillus]|uniref:MarR family transcriptional regulator n=1 Tax=Lactobacillus xujianguonis TaxID=2495899 RepID=A0A437SXW2_9LACO|nr:MULTISPECIES: MarR family winged helix-turn-helix transcriptional regulator [Lactobacillus]RVU71748.1 MarR family transcriptional regulator [Lactobacillus xujianguonis]RVU77578.1 MarR family transcriptional regulator [Lactobacillus xujianguonis]
MDVLLFSAVADNIKKEINHKCGLNLSQTRLLLYFAENDNSPLTMGRLAEGLNISLSTLSRQLQQARTKSYIEIVRSEKDSSKNVKLNEAGINKVKELQGFLIQIESNLFSSLTKHELSSFTKELEKVVEYSNAMELA